MKVLANRETIAGIEVVDAAVADAIILAAHELIESRQASAGTGIHAGFARELFGHGSEEDTLWRALAKERHKETDKKWKRLKRVVEAASNSEGGTFFSTGT